MIGRIEAFFRRLRRGFSRSEWLVRLLRLSIFAGPATEPGLVIIQIDGLSHTQLSRALKRGRLPFLKRLIKHEHYRLHQQYAGVPSTTLAVQAELFYGIKTAVPGFNFMDRSTGKLVRMVEPEIAASVESTLEKNGNNRCLKAAALTSTIIPGAGKRIFVRCL